MGWVGPSGGKAVVNDFGTGGVHMFLCCGVTVDAVSGRTTEGAAADSRAVPVSKERTFRVRNCGSDGRGTRVGRGASG